MHQANNLDIGNNYTVWHCTWGTETTTLESSEFSPWHLELLTPEETPRILLWGSGGGDSLQRTVPPLQGKLQYYAVKLDCLCTWSVS